MDTEKTINIFITGDNKIYSLVLKQSIEKAFNCVPVNIQIFETGEKCMEKLKQVKPELVILDYYLNSEFPSAANGIEVLDWIKKENPETDVIMLTMDDQIETALNSFHHKASDFIVKNKDQFEKINHSIANILSLHGCDVKKVKLNGQTEKELNANILKLTMRINEQYPELSKYIEEMGETLPDETNPEIALKNLKSYYESLNSMLNNYIMKHPTAEISK